MQGSAIIEIEVGESPTLLEYFTRIVLIKGVGVKSTMNYVRKFTTIIFCVIFVNGYAAFNGISDHSRANCVTNESITWDYTEPHRLCVVGFHTADYMNKYWTI